MSQAAELLGVQAAFLRALDSSGVLQPHRSPGGHRRYSRQQLAVAARMRGLLRVRPPPRTSALAAAPPSPRAALPPLDPQPAERGDGPSCAGSGPGLLAAD